MGPLRPKVSEARAFIAVLQLGELESLRYCTPEYFLNDGGVTHLPRLFPAPDVNETKAATPHAAEDDKNSQVLDVDPSVLDRNPQPPRITFITYRNREIVDYHRRPSIGTSTSRSEIGKSSEGTTRDDSGGEVPISQIEMASDLGILTSTPEFPANATDNEYSVSGQTATDPPTEIESSDLETTTSPSNGPHSMDWGTTPMEMTEAAVAETVNSFADGPTPASAEIVAMVDTGSYTESPSSTTSGQEPLGFGAAVTDADLTLDKAVHDTTTLDGPPETRTASITTDIDTETPTETAPTPGPADVESGTVTTSDVSTSTSASSEPEGIDSDIFEPAIAVNLIRPESDGELLPAETLESLPQSSSMAGLETDHGVSSTSDPTATEFSTVSESVTGRSESSS